MRVLCVLWFWATVDDKIMTSNMAVDVSRYIKYVEIIRHLTAYTGVPHQVMNPEASLLPRFNLNPGKDK